MKTLETERLILRSWRETDLEDFFEYASNELVGPNAGWKPHKNIEESKNKLNEFIESDIIYAVELKKEKKVIGGLGLHTRCPDPSISEKNQVELGYVLNPKYWGKGYMPEAVNQVIIHCFEELGVDLIWCGHYDFNNKSKRVNEKCGFEYHFTKEEILERLDNKKVTTLYYNIKNI